MKKVSHLYQFECNLFHLINNHYDHKRWNSFFHMYTHIGGAIFTIGITLCVLLFSIYTSSTIGIQMAVALAMSHLPVALIKKWFPRKRPYLVLEQSKVTSNPLSDHSFPSGHTTAIFSIVTPIILQMPIFGILLLPLAVLVGVSRIFLGLHYPSDVLVGGVLGSAVGFFTILML